MLATRRSNLQQRMIFSTLERHPDMDRFSGLTGVTIATVLAIGAVSSLTAGGRTSGRIANIDRTVAATATRAAVQTVEALEPWLSCKVRDERHVITNWDT
jgi:hypothetical protein